MEIKKLCYSVNPWRLLRSDGTEVRSLMNFDHPDIGMTQVLQPISGKSRKECEAKAMALLEQLLLGKVEV